MYIKKKGWKLNKLTPLLHYKFLKDNTRIGHTSSHGRTVVEKRRENWTDSKLSRWKQVWTEIVNCPRYLLSHYEYIVMSFFNICSKQGCHFTWKNLVFDNLGKKKTWKYLEFEKFWKKPEIFIKNLILSNFTVSFQYLTQFLTLI